MDVLTAAESGSTVRLPHGEGFVVQLPENPTTGYLWAIDAIQGPLEMASSQFTLSGEAAPGAGGTRALTFATTGSGSAHVILKLWQEWEGDASVTDRFEIWVDVADTLN